MSKFPPPKFYATDKDVHDLFSRLSAEALISLARGRGLMVSHLWQKDSIVAYMARQMHSLPQLQTALKLMERDEREEKATPSKLQVTADVPEIAQAFERVRDERKDPDERMRITQRPTGELEVKVEYTHLDLSKATLRQRVTKEVTFLVNKNGDVANFSYNNNAKAAEIYSEVKKVLKGDSPNEITESVSLSSIPEPKQKVQFFLELMNGIQGFRLRAVRNVKAERSKSDKSGSDEEEAEAKERVEDMVKKMALDGSSVWTSPEFASMIKNGFFVYSARWLGTELEGANRVIEFDAGFSSGECLDFAVRVLGVYKRKDDGTLETKVTPMSATEKESLRAIVHDSAFEAVEKAMPKP